jgi:hypothetical protein
MKKFLEIKLCSLTLQLSSDVSTVVTDISTVTYDTEHTNPSKALIISLFDCVDCTDCEDAICPCDR